MVGKTTDDEDLKHVEEVLNADHFGLEIPKSVLLNISLLKIDWEPKTQFLLLWPAWYW